MIGLLIIALIVGACMFPKATGLTLLVVFCLAFAGAGLILIHSVSTALHP